jgi:hypothetical protein
MTQSSNKRPGTYGPTRLRGPYRENTHPLPEEPVERYTLGQDVPIPLKYFTTYLGLPERVRTILEAANITLLGQVLYPPTQGKSWQAYFLDLGLNRGSLWYLHQFLTEIGCTPVPLELVPVPKQPIRFFRLPESIGGGKLISTLPGYDGLPARLRNSLAHEHIYHANTLAKPPNTQSGMSWQDYFGTRPDIGPKYLKQLYNFMLELGCTPVYLRPVK